MRVLVVLAAFFLAAFVIGCGASVTTDQEVQTSAGSMTVDPAASTDGGTDGYVYIPTMSPAGRQASAIISAEPTPPEGYQAAAGVLVSCAPLAGGQSRQALTTTTDAYGYFLFIDLTAGTYMISVTGATPVNVTVVAGSLTHPDGEQSVLPPGFRAIFVDLSVMESWPQLREMLKDVNWIQVGFTSDNPNATALAFNLYMGDVPQGEIVAGPRNAALIQELSLPTESHTFNLGDINISMTQQIKDLVFGGRFWLYGWVEPAPTSPVIISNIQVRLSLKIGQDIL